MIGTIVNAAAIVAGGVAALATKKQPSPLTERFVKVALGALAVYVGLKLTLMNLDGPFTHRLKQLGIVVLAMMLGKLTGRLLHIQKGTNRLGQYAKKRLASPAPTARLSEGFVTCTILFCVAPLATLGAVLDGLNGNYQPLMVKAVMDGFSMLAFVSMFGRGALLAVVPVVAYQGTITLLAQALARSLDPLFVVSINATGGLLVFSIALVILELKKIELADYLPSLVFAPVLARWLG